MAVSAKNNPPPAWATQWPTDSVGRLLEVEVALSGGMDSVVLLHGLWQWAHWHDAPLRAVHVHHGISPNADAWAQFCVDLCQKYGIALRIVRVAVQQNGAGLEAAARDARYAVFAQSPAPIVALAHHADDQNETFLLAALRGGGLRALAAMPVFRLFNQNITLWRPLLNISRNALLHQAKQHDLKWIEDESNADTAYLRNALRHAVLPVLHQSVPHLTAQLHASIAQLQNDLALLDEIAATDAADLCDPRGRWRISRWRRLSVRRRHTQLHHFARTHHLGSPRAASIADFAATLEQAQSGQWQLPHGLVVYYRDCLFIQEQALAAIEHLFTTQPTASGSLSANEHHATTLAMQAGYLKASDARIHQHHENHPIPSQSHTRCAASGSPLCTETGYLKTHAGQWRLPRQGEKIALKGGGHKPLRQILAQLGVPPTLRDIWPIWDDGHRALPANHADAPFVVELAAFQMNDIKHPPD